MILGEIIVKKEDILCNGEKESIGLFVVNTSDRPIQIGSHFHFFEVNRALQFDREKAYGRRLDIAAGTGLRFEPKEEKEVQLIEIGGGKVGYGLNGLTSGKLTDPEIKEKALEKAVEDGFMKEGK